ncbi:MAG: hypothetical protein G01um10148_438 [Parcubacteria group bacterium Gr01-1014_8]|nr:MAG: hypothetical protein G01um10148_438 [Parcubacteria group bacterium Gr01-1014_8]
MVESATPEKGVTSSDDQLSAEEGARLESIKQGDTWPTVEYLTSHPRVIDAVLDSPEGITAMRVLIERAVKPEQRKKLLATAKTLVKEKAGNIETADTISTASIFTGGMLGTGAALFAAAHFVFQDEFGADPNAMPIDLILALILVVAAVITLGAGGLASKAMKVPRQHLDSVFEELFGHEWRKTRQGANRDPRNGPMDDPYQYL